METKREAIKFLNEMRDRFIDEKKPKSSSDLKVISAIGLVCGMAEDSISSKWISVDDRLPEETNDDDCNDVICYLHNPKKQGMVICLSTNGKLFIDTETQVDASEYVTHWQPLPDVPEV